MNWKQFNCIIDACSYIYLHQSTFNFGGKNQTLFSLLNKNVKIVHSAIVNNEITKNFASPEKPLKRSNRNHSFSTRNHKLINYDNTFFSGEISKSTTGKDNGEKANFAVSLDLVLSHKKSSAIFLTDDKKAISETSAIKELLENFPFFLIWSSFEVILFLYLSAKKTEFTLDIAQNSLRDINSFIYSTKQTVLKAQFERGEFDKDTYSSKNQKIKEKGVKNLKKYNDRLIKVHEAKNM